MTILLKITTVIDIIKTTTPTTMIDIEITTDTEATVKIFVAGCRLRWKELSNCSK